MIYFVKYESISGLLIKAALKTRGGSALSRMDADGFRQNLLSKTFYKAPTDLCKAILNFIKKRCSEIIPSTNSEAFVACRLIPLDKTPGLRLLV